MSLRAPFGTYLRLNGYAFADSRKPVVWTKPLANTYVRHLTMKLEMVNSSVRGCVQ
jgi:hypothetical protein